MTNNKRLLIIFGVLFAIIVGVFVFWLLADPFAQKNNDQAVKAQPTKVIKKLEMPEEDYPVISMALKNNDHYVDLTINKIPSYVKEIEFEFLYNSIDEKGQEFQKGQFDSFEINEERIEKEILLGTSSCTTGTCKYRYDENVSSGKLALKLKDEEGKVASFDIPFLVAKGNEDANLSELENNSPDLELTNPNSSNLILHKTLGYYERPNQAIFAGPYQLSSTASQLPFTYSGSESIYVFGTDGWTISDEIPLNSLFIAVNE